MRPRTIFFLILAGLGAGYSLRAQQPADPAAHFNQAIIPFMEQNCHVCHNATVQRGGVDLTAFKTFESVQKNRDIWRDIVAQVETGSMPPRQVRPQQMPATGLPAPSEEAKQGLLTWIKGEFTRQDSLIKAAAGRVTARRLNKTEYNNTIQDLLGIKAWPADEFPQDDANHGFDNVADALSISPVLMERYLTAAEKIARIAVYGPEKMQPSLRKLEQLEREVTNITTIPAVYDETGLNTDRSLHAIFRFPVDGVYLFKLCSRGFRPLGCDPLETGLWIDGKLVKEFKVDPVEDGPSLLGGRQDLFGKPQSFEMYMTAGDHWIAGSVLRMFEGLPAVYGGKNPSSRPLPNVNVPVSNAVDPEAIRLARINEERERQGLPPLPPASQPAEADVAAAPASQPAAQAALPAAPASQPAQVAQGAAPPASQPQGENAQIAQADPDAPPAEGRGRGRGRGRGGRGGRGRGGLPPIETQIGIDYIDIIGPIQQKLGPTPESLLAIYGTENFDKNSPDAPQKVITRFVSRAFRRPATEAEISRYVRLFDMVRRQGDSFDEALVIAIQGVLVSSEFLFRIERDPQADAAETPITEHELASRVSYFLWSTMPDDELMGLADKAELRKPGVMETQVKRMLKSPRSSALAKNFAGQWLRFRALESVTPDFNVFPEFDLHLKMSMEEESVRFFEHVMREDKSILDFIDGRYTFINERLAEFYGIPGVKGTQFQKVDLTDTPRGGIITQGSVLTVSSYATRTSPVLRGKWILENILNAPPPEPPASVPALEEVLKNNPNATVRKQLEIHRENPSCAGCHSRMDPLGIGLENFNAIGKWRTQEGTETIDASGELPGGRKFNGPTELRQLILADKDAFAQCLTEKLMIYSLGRGIEPYDGPTVKQIAANVAKDNYRFDRLVVEIVNSLPFQKRTKGTAP